MTNRTEIRIDRKNNFHDYNFDDWEETTPLLYFDVDFTIASTNLSTTQPDTELTTPKYSTYTTESDVPTTQAQTSDIPVTTENENVQTTTEVESTPDVTTETEIHDVPTDIDTTAVTETYANIIPNNETITSSVTETVSTINITSDVTTPIDEDRTEATDSTEYTETTTIATTTTTAVTEKEDALHYYLTTTTELILTPPDNIVNSTTASTPTPTVSPLILEVKSLMETLKYGYFTSVMITFMRVVASKEDTALEPLKKALHDEINAAQMGNRLDMFGQIAANVIGELSEMWSLAPSDFVKTQATFLYVSLTNRKTHYSPEVNAIFDLIDNAYTADDAMNVISCIADIEAFPNTTQSARSIASNLLQFGIFLPYERIRGTTKDKLLLLEIENIITQRMAGPMSRRKVPFRQTSKGTRNQLRKPITTLKRKLTRSQKRKVLKTKEKQSRRPKILKESPMKLNQRPPIEKQKQLKRLRGRQAILTKEHPMSPKEDNQIRLFDFFGTTKLTSTTDVDLDYLRNETIMQILRQKMKIYKEKWKRIRKKENKPGIKRGKTTTTTTTTTTVKPTMRKSKYYIRKYVKKDLYRMKTTTPSTTTKKKWFRRQYEERDRSESVLNCSCSSETSCSRSIEDIEDKRRVYANDKTYTNKKPMKTEIRIAVTKNNRKIVFRNKYNVDYDTKRTLKDMRIDSIKSINNKYQKSSFLRRTEHSDYSNYEKELKANVLDALVHGRDHGLEAYRNRRRYNVKMAPFQSNSNEELILKANIYKAFGYNNDFAARIKS